MAPRKVVVVGAGPVGALAALYAATRGDDVELYELRSDLRETDTTPLNFTKSINLALSERGINGLKSSGHAGLLDAVLKDTIPMYGRMVHVRNATGQLIEDSQAYDVHGRFQRSVDRGVLNKIILQELSKLSNVKLVFQHKLTGADFRTKKAWFEALDKKAYARAPEIEVGFDLMIGADGAHSATRHHMMKYARMNYQQEYIDCLWTEFTMTPSPAGEYSISPNHLHIWPGGSFMFIALPNLDKSFTCTFFAPTSVFTQLEQGDDELLKFFNERFPGVTRHISPEALMAQFKQNPHLPLIHIKCSPHHFEDSVVILGDAANAMVPFYGQGMNAGLESVRVLFSKLDTFSARSDALSSYTSTRTTDTYTIADLALANYVEMSSSVTSRLYKIRKLVEERLDKYFPRLGWATQYSRVSFSNMRYSDVIKRSEYQKTALTTFLTLLLGVLGTGLAVTAAKLSLYLLQLLRSRRAQKNAVR